jgi:rhodanese-related sulfurtransferase
MPAASHLVTPDPTQGTGASGPWLLDVRTPGEFRALHVPGSTNIPLADLPGALTEVGRLAAGRPIVLVCQTGRRAATAREILERVGFADLRVLEGGVVAWSEAGGAVERGVRGRSLEAQARLITGAAVFAGTMLGVFVSPWLLAIPALLGAAMVFSGIIDSCALAALLGRLPFNRR